MSAFDPWTADTLEVEEAQAAWLASGKKSDPSDPASQFWAVANVAARKHTIMFPVGPPREDDEGREILWCVRVCLSHGLIAPEWLAGAFARRFDAVFNADVGSWGDVQAFGTPYPKGTHLAAQRKALKNGPKVVSAVEKILRSDPQTPIDKALFERIGKPLGLGTTLAEELYYAFRINVPLPKKARTGHRETLPRKLKN